MSVKVKLSIAFTLSLLLLVGGLFFFLLPPRDPAGGGAGATPESATAVAPAARPGPADPAPKAAVRKKEPAPRKETAPRDPPPPGGGWTISGRIVRLAAGGDAAAATVPSPPGPPKGEFAGTAVVPAEGAAVHLKSHPRRNKPGEGISPRTRKTGPDGRFEFTGVPGKVHLRFEVDEPSSAQQTLSFRLPDPDTESHQELGDVLIEPGADLTVHLVGPRGEPVEKATILMNKDSSNPKRSAYLEQIGFKESRRELTEKGKGVYLLERVPLGPLHLDARAPGYAPSGKVMAEIPRAEPLVVTLLEGSVISGRVLAAAGEPIAGATLETGSSSAPTKTTTDASGAFVFDAIGEGDQAVSVSADGYVSARKSGVSAGTRDLEFTLTPEAVFSGKVLSEEDGKPVVQATVTLKGLGRGAASFSADVDAKGNFAVRKVTAGSYTAIADHPEFEPAPEETLELKEGERITGRVLRLKRGLVATGRVLDSESQAGVPEAQVTFRLNEDGRPSSVRRTAKSGSDGSFEVKGLKEGMYTYSAVAKGYFASKTDTASLSARGGKEFKLVLEQGSSVSGRVLDRSGQPISGAMVRPNVSIGPGAPRDGRLNSISNLSAQTDPEGAYRLDGLPPSTGYLFQATHGSYAPGSLRGVSVGQRESVEGADIVLSRGGSIQGRILDEEGKGIAGAALQVTRDRNSPPVPPEGAAPQADDTAAALAEELAATEQLAFRSSSSANAATSDPEGAYQIQHLEAGTYTVRAQVKGRAPGSRDKVAVTEEQVTAGVDITLLLGETLAGRVIDLEGNPVTGVDIRSYELNFAQVRSNAEGRFELKGLPAGKLNLAVSKSGFEAQNQAVDVPGREVVFTLMRSAKVSGTIRAADETSFPGWQLAVIAVRDGGRPRGSASSYQNDPRGRFETDLTAGSYYLLATVPGYAPSKSAQFTIKAAEQLEGLVIDLLPGAAIRGTVVLAGTGEPVAGASIAVSPAQNDPNANFGWGRQNVNSGPDGAFLIEGIAEGTVTIQASHRDYAHTGVPLTVRAGSETALRLEMTAGGSLHGVVTRGGQPLPGARVHASKQDPLAYAGKDGTTDAGGRYQIKGLPAGEYQVRMLGTSRRSSGLGNSQPATVFEGQATELNFEEGNPIRLFGRVTSGGLPVSGGNISAMQVERGWGGANSRIDSAGRYSLELSAPGEYQLMIDWRGDGRGAKQQVLVPEGQSVVQHDIVLSSGELSGVVVDAETGNPVPAQVMAFTGGIAARSFGALLRGMQGMSPTDGGGRFVVGNLAPGRYTLRAFAEGYVDARLEGLEVGDAGGADGLELALERGIGLRLRVVDAGGRPVAGAMVFLRDAGGELVLFSRPFTSDVNGLVDLHGLRPGGYRATVNHPAYATASINVQAGEAAAEEPVVSLRPGGRVQVKVVQSRGGRPVEGAEVEILDEQGQNVAEDRFFFGPGGGQATLTGAAGSLTLDQVASGTYRLAARRGKDRSREEKVPVVEGQVAGVTLVLP